MKDLKGDLEIHIKWGPVKLKKKIKNVHGYELMPRIEHLTKKFNADLDVDESLSHVIKPLTLKIKYMGSWLIKVKHENVPIKYFGKAVYDMSLLIQRTNDQLKQGTTTPSNVIKVQGERTFGDEYD